MIDQTIFRQQLFANPEYATYTILDGAAIPALLKMLWLHKPEHICLYRGELDEEMAQIAPYLVRLWPDSPFTEYVLQGWGQHWGLFLFTQADLRTLRKHFRTFLMVHAEDGRPLYFRYYDPRVWRVYLPTCTAEEAAAVFGPVIRYLLEDEDPTIMLQYGLTQGQIDQRRIPLSPQKVTG